MPIRPTDTLHDVGEFIRQQRENAQKSIRDLARSAGVSNPYLSQIERGIRRPSADILQQIARALEISAETLYVRAGFLKLLITTSDSRVNKSKAFCPCIGLLLGLPPLNKHP
jgi:transcriptional regulator with XRE-family HTH domain